MRHLLAFVAAWMLAAGPVLADAPGPASGAGRLYGARPMPRGARPASARRLRGPGTEYGFAAADPGYGPEPPYFDGMGGASEGGGPVALSLYREPHIGRGLVYNVPPQPFLRASNVISVRY